MTDEDDQGGTDAAEAFEAMRGELALLRRAVEGLAAERGAIDVPDYTETLGRMQQGVDATAARVALLARLVGVRTVREVLHGRDRGDGVRVRREGWVVRLHQSSLFRGRPSSQRRAD